MTEDHTADELKFKPSKKELLVRFFSRLSTYIPRLVWEGDEIDVDIVIQGDIAKIFQVEEKFHDLGIEFDAAYGYGLRDWEWDWSLSGPISIKFVRRSKNKDQRLVLKPENDD